MTHHHADYVLTWHCGRTVSRFSLGSGNRLPGWKSKDWALPKAAQVAYRVRGSQQAISGLEVWILGDNPRPGRTVPNQRCLYQMEQNDPNQRDGPVGCPRCFHQVVRVTATSEKATSRRWRSVYEVRATNAWEFHFQKPATITPPGRAANWHEWYQHHAARIPNHGAHIGLPSCLPRVSLHI